MPAKGKILMGKTPKPVPGGKPKPGKQPPTRGKPVGPGGKNLGTPPKNPRKKPFPGGGKEVAPVMNQKRNTTISKLIGGYGDKIGNSLAPKVQISGLLGKMTPGRSSIYKGTDKSTSKTKPVMPRRGGK